MVVTLRSSEPEFEERFQELLGAKREDSPDVDAAVADIIAQVRAEGDSALLSLTERFDRVTLTASQLRFTAVELDALYDQVSDPDLAALELAAERIEAYHRRQLPQDETWHDETGAMLGWRWSAVDAAGLYVPGGLASYPSSVLMNAIPAKVAGVRRLAITVPTPDGVINPLVVAAARVVGVDEIYRLGGAQAIAAMAYGTQTVAPVDKITGPGNAFVAAAKRRVFGKVGIDMIAGPSEILLIADDTMDPEWAALDLLSQAEHDESAQSIVLTNSEEFAAKLHEAIGRQLQLLERRAIAGASWRDFGAVIIVRDWAEAIELSNRIAPEHLEIATENAQELCDKVRHAGAIFIGGWTPEAIGDYVGGPNHVLPTARSARFSSGLSVLDFMKRTTLARMTPEALRHIGPAAVRLAASESLQAHGLSVSARLAKLNSGQLPLD